MRRAVLASLTLVAATLVVQLTSTTTASADTKITTKYATQRMDRPNTPDVAGTQVSSYKANTAVNVRCWVAGQRAYNGGKSSTLWYRDTAGLFVPGIDFKTNTTSAPSGVGKCGATVPGLSTSAWYEIVPNHATSKRVDVAGGRVGNGTAVQQYSANGSKSQRFRFISTGGGFFRVESQLGGGQVWNAKGAASSNGTRIQTYKWAGATMRESQWLVYSPSGKLNDVRMQPRHNTTKCLDVKDRSTKDKAPLQLWTCGSGSNQRFTLKKIASIAPAHNLKSPFEPGQKWFVYQGYKSGTHANGYALDLTTSSSGTSSYGKKVRAVASGTVHYWQAAYGNLCVNTKDGRSYTLTHIATSYRAGQAVTAGKVVGTIAKAGSVGNNGVAHLHLGLWKNKNCYDAAGGAPAEQSFSAGNKARLCGLPDMVASGPKGSNGIWSGRSGTVPSGC